MAIRIIPPKLRTRATISNGDMASFRKTHPSKEVQKGAVLKIVFCTTKGMKAIPKVSAVKPIVPITLLMTSNILS